MPPEALVATVRLDPFYSSEESAATVLSLRPRPKTIAARGDSFWLQPGSRPRVRVGDLYATDCHQEWHFDAPEGCIRFRHVLHWRGLPRSDSRCDLMLYAYDLRYTYSLNGDWKAVAVAKPYPPEPKNGFPQPVRTTVELEGLEPTAPGSYDYVLWWGYATQGLPATWTVERLA